MVKIIKLLFLFLVFFTFNATASEFDGHWEGVDKCSDSSLVAFEIKNGKTKTLLPSLTGRVTHVGKIYQKFGSKNYKLGLNSNSGRIEADFISANKLVFDKGTSCEFTVSKMQSSTTAPNYTDETISNLKYCVNNSYNRVYFLIDRECFSNHKEVTKNEFDNYKSCQPGGANSYKTTLPYCDGGREISNLEFYQINELPLFDSNFCIIYPKASSCLKENDQLIIKKDEDEQDTSDPGVIEVKLVKIIKDSKLYNSRWKMCTKEELKQKYWRGCQDPKKYTAKVKKNEIFKLVFTNKGSGRNQNKMYAYITNTKEWRKKGSIEGYIPTENIKFLEENYFFKVKKPKIISSKTDTTKKEKNTSSEVKVSKSSIEVEQDKIKPKINVNNLFESNSSLIATVEGSINDQSEIAIVTMDGYEIALNNNNFSKEFFVKPKGQEIEIVAIDIHGNKSSKIISLKRQKETIQQVKFDFLNPTKIQNTLNNNKAALIIGVESYENTFTALYAENDALYFNDYANTSLGVPKENIKLLVNNDAERNDTLKVISKWLPTVVKENQTELFVYFSGHGLASEDGKDLYLLPTDGDPDLLELTALMRNQLFDQISSLKPKSVTVFLDTCYSGATRSDELLVASRPIFIEAEEQDVPTNFTIFSASAGKETAKVLKEAEHGLFSYFMMKGLEGEADSNNDRTITNGELHAFINKNVSRQANQTPQLNGDPNQVLVTW